LRSCFSTFIATLALLLAAGVASADPVAFVVALKGSATVTSKARGTRAALGRGLERGDKVQVGAGGSVTLFFSDGNIVELGGGSSLTVSGQLTSSAQKIGPGSNVPAEVFTRVSKFVASKNRQAGMVALSAMRGGAEDTPLILAPRRSATLEARPTFSWRSVSGATRYRVAVSTEAGLQWSSESADTTIAYPADATALTANTDYVWEVEALSDTGPVGRREESSFRVLAEPEVVQVRDHLEGLRKAAGDGTAADLYLSGSYLVGRGLYAEAAQEFEALCKLTPEAAGAHEALGNVYQTMGLTDRAAVELSRAQALGPDNAKKPGAK
jgi:hypothetical protein